MPILVIIFIFTHYSLLHHTTYAQTPSPYPSIVKGNLIGSKFIVQTVFAGINFNSNMAFLGPNDILLLEKNEGTVKRITNGALLENHCFISTC